MILREIDGKKQELFLTGSQNVLKESYNDIKMISASYRMKMNIHKMNAHVFGGGQTTISQPGFPGIQFNSSKFGHYGLGTIWFK